MSSNESDNEEESESEDEPRKRKTYYGRESESRQHVKARTHEEDTAGVYVLRNLSTNICYVGKSLNVSNRILQHRYENNADILKRETLLTNGSVDDLESWERNEVLTQMFTEGMDCVRGWRYTSRGPLTQDVKQSAKADIIEKFDLCRRCGRDSHFSNNCYARRPASWCKDMPFK